MRSVTSLKRKVVTVAALIATVALLAGCTGIPRLPDRDILQIEALLDAYETALYEADWEEFSKLLAAPVTIERVLRDDELGDDFDPDVVLPALREQLPEGTELDMELTDGGWLFTFSMEHPTQVPAALGESLVLGQLHERWADWPATRVELTDRSVLGKDEVRTVIASIYMEARHKVETNSRLRTTGEIEFIVKKTADGWRIAKVSIVNQEVESL